MDNDKRQYAECRYDFTDDEIRHMGEALARENQNLLDLRERKANAAAAYQSEIKEATLRAADLATRIVTRHEMRSVEVCVVMDSPRPGMKALVRIDNPDDIIQCEPMTATEKQASFGFDLDIPGGE